MLDQECPICNKKFSKNSIIGHVEICIHSHDNLSHTAEVKSNKNLSLKRKQQSSELSLDRKQHYDSGKNGRVSDEINHAFEKPDIPSSFTHKKIRKLDYNVSTYSLFSRIRNLS